MIDQENLNKLKIALDQIENGEVLERAVANAEYVNYDQKLIDKINILKNIPVLNAEILKYLYKIQLTDKISEVAPKVNVIYQLALNANLIEDKALEKEKSKHDTEEKTGQLKQIVGSNDMETATNVLRALLNINK